MTKQQRFDRILEILGLAKGSELASALGLTRKSSSYCRQNGVPEFRLGGGALVIIPAPTTDADGKPAVHFAEIIALGLGSWPGRSCIGWWPWAGSASPWPALLLFTRVSKHDG
jgi:hypothetical protein